MDQENRKISRKHQESNFPKDQCLAHKEDGVPNDENFENPSSSGEEWNNPEKFRQKS